MASQFARPKDNPWKLKTPPGTSQYAMHTDEKDGKKILICTVGSTVLHYDARCIDDLHAMLGKAGDWVERGGADEQKPAKEGTVEGWGVRNRIWSAAGTASRWACRGALASISRPLTEALGLCELAHNAKNNPMRAK